MKIWTHHYELRPGADRHRAARAPRRGALVRVEFEDGATGHADLHPWTEFGHPPLDRHLDSLRSGQPTVMAGLALRHARTDAAARRPGLSLFEGLPGIRSHALFTEWVDADSAVFERCAAAGHAAAKLKVGRDPGREARTLNELEGTGLRWRLDANSAFTAESFAAWAGRLSPDVRNRVEFVEDCCPYEAATWGVLAEKTALPLALDWELPEAHAPWPGAAVLVIKPAAQDAFALALAAAQGGMGIVVTHSMDHPLGRATALWTAMRLRQRHGGLVRDGGLQGAPLYAADAFSEQLVEIGAETAPPPGTGFGFDELLSSTPWRLLQTNGTLLLDF